MERLLIMMRLLTHTLLVVNLMLVLILVMNPALAGRWLAHKDIGHDTIWMTYVADCDCTGSLE